MGDRRAQLTLLRTPALTSAVRSAPVDLLGRAEECRVLEGLLESARGGFGGTLVVRGEAGIGKTALLDHMCQAASDFLIVRFTGSQPEQQLGYAALHRLLTPVLHQIERLPEPQRDALNSVVGLAAGGPANPFLVGLGTLSLAANAVRARHRLLCVIDDAQWVDAESLEALAFWGRRIQADCTALVFGGRPTARTSDGPLDGFDRLEIAGLPADAARALLRSHAPVALDHDVAERIIAETEGHPLAIVEIARDSARRHRHRGGSQPPAAPDESPARAAVHPAGSGTSRRHPARAAPVRRGVLR